MTGDPDGLLKAVSDDVKSYQVFIRDKLLKLLGTRSIGTHFLEPC